MAKPNRTAFLGRTTSWARWERTSRRLGRRGKSASLVSRVPDAEGRRQVAVSAENDAAGRVVELRHARCFAASVGCDCLARHDRQHFGLVMRQRLPADDYDHRALLVMALEREQPGLHRPPGLATAVAARRRFAKGLGGRTRACWSTPTPWRADLRRPTAALAVAVTVEPDAAPVTAFAPAHSAQEDRGQGNRCEYQDRHATETSRGHGAALPGSRHRTPNSRATLTCRG